MSPLENRNDPVKYVSRASAKTVKERICLICDKPFLSTGPGNRVCKERCAKKLDRLPTVSIRKVHDINHREYHEE